MIEYLTIPGFRVGGTSNIPLLCQMTKHQGMSLLAHHWPKLGPLFYPPPPFISPPKRKSFLRGKHADAISNMSSSRKVNNDVCDILYLDMFVLGGPLTIYRTPD